ncbi:hypothetical protein MTO96_008142 [Rhipicephalus appendiculatus]
MVSSVYLRIPFIQEFCKCVLFLCFRYSFSRDLLIITVADIMDHFMVLLMKNNNSSVPVLQLEFFVDILFVESTTMTRIRVHQSLSTNTVLAPETETGFV